MDTVGSRLVPLLGQLVQLLRESGTTDQPSLVVLGVLGRLSREGPRRLTDLARAERATQPAMSQLVERMTREGYVRRAASPADGRVTMVELTGAGAAAYAAQVRLLADVVDARLTSLSRDDRARVEAALPVLDALTHPGPTAGAVA